MCNNLGIKIRENIYATNLYKNFFVAPPTTIEEGNIFSLFLDAWLPLLKYELEQFRNIPVFSLGEPILAPILKPGIPAKVREYWGYDPGWKNGKAFSLRYIESKNNLLARELFPFPHQPSIRKEFYRTNLKKYTMFMKRKVYK